MAIRDYFAAGLLGILSGAIPLACAAEIAESYHGRQVRRQNIEHTSSKKRRNTTKPIVVTDPRQYCTMNYADVIKAIRTPEQVKNYLETCMGYKSDQKVYGQRDYQASFKVIHERAKKNCKKSKNKKDKKNCKTFDDCDGKAYTAAAQLSDDGYKPLLLYVKDSRPKGKAHMVFIYTKRNRQGKVRYGCLGVENIDPRFSSENELVASVWHGRFDRFIVFDISKYYPDWITNNKNMKDALNKAIKAKKLKKVKFPPKRRKIKRTR